MSSVAAPPVNAVPTTNGVTSEVAAAPTTNNANNAGAAVDATTASEPAGQNNTTPTSPEETGHKVFAGNLAYATTDEGLKTFFSAFTNDIVSSEVIHRGSRPAGYGFVTFKVPEAAEKAVVELHEKELDGRPVIVQHARPTAEKERVRNERRAKRRATGRRNARAPPGEVTEAEAEGQVENSASGVVEKAENAVEGEVATDAIKPKKRKNRNNRAKKAAAAAAAEGTAEDTATGEPSAGAEAANGTTGAAPARKAKKPRYPRGPRPPRAAGGRPVGEPSKNMLFVANLAFSVDDARLKEIFTDAGINVVSARVITHRWGGRRSKGFGFVDAGNEEEQKKALDYFAPVESADGTTGKEVDGRQIAVKVAVDTPRKESGATDAGAAANSAEKSDATPETTVVAH